MPAFTMYIDMVQDLIEGAGARLMFLPPYLPDLNPVEGVYDIMYQNAIDNVT